ncbi:class I SAM-dependent methyltransferase [Sphingomonas montana]|uniref:class I SAM-dependent methyltransferase n=1 Tax=Sphingomonas montana TaxID=1843236 RepID=UPI0009FB5C3E|nr:class I SAM-dependent methyltransferase [Sphingomonas montana]
MIVLRPDDQTWFDAQFDWESSLRKFGIRLPSLPSDEIQTGFTSLSGRQNLLQAFGFYGKAVEYIKSIHEPKIMDFGCGWGRISRFFLRETSPKNMYLVDAMDVAIDCLKNTNNPCNIIYNTKSPPIEGIPDGLDLIYAYSVFSHLSEKYFLDWVQYFLSKLKPGGHIVFTTRGWQFIEHLQSLRDSRGDLPSNLVAYVERLVQDMPTPARIARNYAEGQFQWFPMAGGLELTADFWGETFIPEKYLLEKYGSMLVSFSENTEHVDQSIVVLRKPI